MSAPPAPDDFDTAFQRASPVPGWLTEDQARVLWDAAAAVPATGVVVEIGSHQGRSLLVLAAATCARVVAVDPFEVGWRYGAPDTRARLETHLVEAGLRERVEVRETTSADALASWSGPADVVYVDGKHDYWTARDDLRWSRTVPPGGLVLVHDAFSSFGVTLALLRVVLPHRRLRYTGRVGSLAILRVAPPRFRDRMRVFRELPWFARNLAVKVLLRLRLRPAAVVLGHRGDDDPY